MFDMIDEPVDYDLADRIEAALETAGREGMTPSQVARKIGDRYVSAELTDTLGWLVRNQYAHASGNGAWTHYHAGRA